MPDPSDRKSPEPTDTVTPTPTPIGIKIHRPNKADLERYYHAKQGELESQRLRLEYGWIARIVGTKNSSNNIAFVITVLLLLAGFAVLLGYPQDRIEFWKSILPSLTLTLGYLFGNKPRD